LICISSGENGPLPNGISASLIRPEDRVEFRVAHVKGVVMHLEVVPIVEIERDEQKRERLTGRTRNIIAWPQFISNLMPVMG
jgi:hypothetical protein